MKKTMIIIFSLIIVVLISVGLIFNIETNVKKPLKNKIPTTSTKPLSVEAWKDIQLIYKKQSILSIEKKVNILSSASNLNPIEFVVYPIYIENKHISTYGEEEYYENYYKIFDSIPSNISNNTLSISIQCNECEIIKVKNTGNTINYKTIENNTVWIENTYSPNSLYIIKIKDKNNDIYEILFK